MSGKRGDDFVVDQPELLAQGREPDYSAAGPPPNEKRIREPDCDVVVAVADEVSAGPRDPFLLRAGQRQPLADIEGHERKRSIDVPVRTVTVTVTVTEASGTRCSRAATTLAAVRSDGC